MCHVLIIEDEALIALDLAGLLAQHGAASFDYAETEAEAVAFAKRRRPDVITSDVRLRQGTGPQAVASILAELGPVPVLFLTANPADVLAIPEGASVFGKPMQEWDVAQAFRELAST